MTTETPYSYSELISVDELERITRSHRDSEDHYTFVISHQVSELWFLLIIRELEAFLEQPDMRHLDRVAHAASALNETWEVLATLSVQAFSEIRRRLEGMSGQESANYFRIRTLMDLACKEASDADLVRRLSEIDTTLAVWRFKHALVARKLIGEAPGTGGSRGATDLEGKVFDTHLRHEHLRDNASSENGACPFS